jgi:orotate phosphoribosyltransferase
MTPDEVLEEFRQAGALLEGHFVLSSGRHSPIYFQKARVFQDPPRAERLCRALADKVRALGTVDIVVSPAVGAIVAGYETARRLGVHALFVEREDGAFRLRRGFQLQPGARVAVVEDIVTTGQSARECVAALTAEGGRVVCVACLIDRSGGAADVGAPLVALAQVSVPSFAPDALPPELRDLPVDDPGSRRLRSAAA